MLVAGAPNHPHLDAQTVHRSRKVCVLHPKHRLAASSHADIGDLSGEVLITLNVDDPISVEFQRMLVQHGAEPAATIETTYSVTICTMALEGIGVGIVNSHVASVFADRLKVRPLRPAFPIDVFLAFAPPSALSTIGAVCGPAARTFPNACDTTRAGSRCTPEPARAALRREEIERRTYRMTSAGVCTMIVR